MLRQIGALTVKDLKILFTDTGGLVTLFLMPFMFVVVMSLALGGVFGGGAQDRPLRLLAVNEDRGPLGGQILRQLDEQAAFQVETTWDGATLTRARAEELVAQRERSLAIVVPAGFSAALEQAPGAGAGSTAKVETIADPASSVQFVGPVMGTLQGLIERASFLAAAPLGIDRFFEQYDPQAPPEVRAALKSLAQQGASPAASSASPPAATVERVAPAGMRVQKFPDAFQQNVPASTLFGIFWIVSLLAQSVLEEKRVGTFRRLLVAPVSRTAMLAGKFLPFYLVTLVQIAVMLGAARLLFGMDLGHSPLALIVVSLAAAATATGLGVLVASLARTDAQVGGLTSLLVLTLAAIGGCFVPRFIMPEWMQTIGLASPHAWALEAYQDLLVRGYGLEEVLPRVGVLAAIALAFFAIGVWRFRFE
jgi:ABC-2 type transport system permease protein